jgi:asparagine synthase (glutamine-hydrolysing)
LTRVILMCGITAIVDATGRSVAERLAVATARLRHRGPDDSSVWLHETGAVGLGHARLSIVDVRHGRQPLSNEDGDVWVTVNGEFYDAEPIRARLESRGHRFSTGSDSELVLHLYEENDVACLRDLRGEFALALWDARRARLFAARDRFGIKPLFYGECGGSLVLASEAKSLFALGLPAAWDPASLIEQLFFFVRQDRTLFRGVWQVPAGHYLLHERGRTSLRSYWDLDFPPAGDGTDAAPVPLERLRETLRDAVRVRLRSEAPLTVFLSGGLDSSCVLALAAACADTAPHALHVSFAGTDYDEVEMARQAAAWVDAPLDVLEVGEADLVAHFADAVWHAETLAFNAHAVARYLQSREAHARGYKVALTGEGADETFGGYPGFRPDAAPAMAPAASGALQRRLGFAPAWIERVHAERAPFYALLDPRPLEGFRFDDVCAAFVDQFDVEGQLRGRHPLQQSMYLWAKSVLPNYTLCADRLDMAHGIETRQPFLDHHLWALTRTLPPDRLIRGYVEKWSLREAAAGWVPETVRARAKHSFTSPAISSGGALCAFANDELRSTDFRSLPFVDHAAVVSLLDLLRDGALPGADSALMVLLSMHLLQRACRLS